MNTTGLIAKDEAVIKAKREQFQARQTSIRADHLVNEFGEACVGTPPIGGGKESLSLRLTSPLCQIMGWKTNL